MKRKNLLALLLSAAMLVTLPACGPASVSPGEGGGDTPPTPPEEKPVTLFLTPSAPYCVEGGTLTFTVTGEGYDAGTLDFTFSDETIISSPVQEGESCTVTVTGAGELTARVTSGEATASCTVTVFPTENVIAVDDPLIYYLGRTEMQDGRMLINNSAAGFDIQFYGKSITLQMKDELVGSIFSVFLDGETDPLAYQIDLRKDLDENGKVTLATFEEPGLHTLRLQKVTEESLSTASLSAITIEEGGLVPYKPAYSFKMEVYGDSITAGYGNLRKDHEEDDWTKQNALFTYAGITARELNAEIRVFAQSGIGLYTNPHGLTHHVKSVYDNVSPQSKTKYDLSSYTPDVVIIYLGTNDIGTAKDYPGNPAFSAAAYKEHYITLIRNLCAAYGQDTVFFLCSGLMETGLASSVRDIAISLYDEGLNVYQVTFPNTGYGGHPRLAAHQNAAAILTEKIRQLTDFDLPN